MLDGVSLILLRVTIRAINSIKILTIFMACAVKGVNNAMLIKHSK